jgi:DNA transposition AAA+ family ATPase
MKDVFAITKNVQRFMAGIEAVRTPIRGRIGMMLAFGPPGTGKTESGMWYAAENNIPYIRAKDISSRRSLLSNIVAELGEAPAFRSDTLFDQAVEQLLENPRPMLIDEVDYLVRGGMVEVLRDLNDITNSPIVLMGMEHADKKLKRFRHLYDRISAVVKFDLFSKEEISALANQICEVDLSGSAISYIHKQSQGKLRLTTTWMARAEKVAKLNKLDQVESEHLQKCLNGGAK